MTKPAAIAGVRFSAQQGAAMNARNEKYNNLKQNSKAMKINLEKLRGLVNFFRKNPERLDMHEFSLYPAKHPRPAGLSSFGNDPGTAKLEKLYGRHGIRSCNGEVVIEILRDFFEMDSINDAKDIMYVSRWPDAARSKYMQADDAGDSAGRVEALEMLYEYVKSKTKEQL